MKCDDDRVMRRLANRGLEPERGVEQPISPRPFCHTAASFPSPFFLHMQPYGVLRRLDMEVRTGKADLEGELYMPEGLPAAAIIIRCVAPGSYGIATDHRLAASLAAHGIAMLRISLLTQEETQIEERVHHYQHDAEFLAQRIIDVVKWLGSNSATARLAVGYCGYYATGAAALVAAAQRPDLVSAVVSINGRTDLAIDYLREVRTPTLLTVNDMPVLRMNREALSQIKGERRIEIVHGGEEPSVALMIEKSVRWFTDRLTPVAA